MLKNYLKIAFRNLIKNKSHTLINVGGLTLGIVSAVIIFLVIQFDLSFDTWHPDADRIYRIVRIDTDFGNTSYNSGGPYLLADAVENDITGIANVAQVNTNYGNTPVITYSENGVVQNKFLEENLAFVEQDYFNIFSTQWLRGDEQSALVRPNTVVINESFAQKMFGSIDVLGKTIVANSGEKLDLEITGVIKDAPKNSDFPFVVLASGHSKTRSGYSFSDDAVWSSSSSSIQTYVKLQPGVGPEQVNAQFDDLIRKYQDEETAKVIDYKLQPLSDIHFNGLYGNFAGRTIEKQILLTLGIIGILLLITACINFINLNTAVAVNRSKEVGLRKTLGGTKTQLTLHFLGETAFISFISLLLSLGITELILQRIEPFLGFSPELNLLSNAPLVAFIGILFVTITLTAGWYPARHLSAFSPIDAIRNKITASYGKGFTLRRSLIVVQFTITQILIIGTIVISSQIKLFQTEDLGYDRDAIVEVPLPNDQQQNLDTFKSALLNESSIRKVTFSNTGTTSNSTWGGNYVITDDTARFENNAQIKFVDADFVDTYGLTILAGKNLSPSDTVTAYLVNEALAKQIGFGDDYNALIGKPNRIWGSEAPIAGVVKNFNTQSLHAELEPVVMATRRSFYLGGIKINVNQTGDAIAAIEQAFNNVYPEAVFEYSFLDENIANMYEDEQRSARIMNAFTFVAILIGSLGLFGLVSYMASTRTKEIGVRKVLGASMLNILNIFATELGILTLISFLIASPVAYFMMQKWLSDFAYKIDLGIGVFALALAGTLVVAALTVGFKALRAATANPVESLKSE